MARQINETSSRQIVLARLSDMRANDEIESRGQAVSAIVAEFDISIAYAKTIYQTFREMLKTAGDLVETFEVKADKSGELKLVSNYKDVAEDGDYLDVATAAEAFKAGLVAQLTELDGLLTVLDNGKAALADTAEVALDVAVEEVLVEEVEAA